MINYIILGVVQGLTEFFPVSSSAHLVIIQRILNINTNVIATTVVLHLGTSLALILFFFKDILKLLRDLKLILFILIVTGITGVVGISGKDYFESLFSSVRLIAVALLVTGTILILAQKFIQGKRNKVNFLDAIILGFTQGIAIIPGISRSGTTISTLLFRKIDRQTAFRMSFIASIPAVLGAALLESKNIALNFHDNANNLAAGFFSSFLTGLIALWALKLIIHKAKLYYFGYYCIIIGVASLLFIK